MLLYGKTVVKEMNDTGIKYRVIKTDYTPRDYGAKELRNTGIKYRTIETNDTGIDYRVKTPAVIEPSPIDRLEKLFVSVFGCMPAEYLKEHGR